MNFFEGVTTDNAELRLADGTTLQLHQQIAPAGTSVTIGARPEHIELGTEGWAAEAVVIEPTGSETQITVRIGSSTARVLVRGRPNVRAGDRIHLGVSPRYLHVFSTETGLAMTAEGA
ncbi:TOBE domain-containing protein [Celeribacter sp.]|uniref:TOBE domain-containing protein n=1 Tax=Celeribacter sp. TaxID=1890673 RepID=UPI003A9136B3